MFRQRIVEGKDGVVAADGVSVGQKRKRARRQRKPRAKRHRKGGPRVSRPAKRNTPAGFAGTQRAIVSEYLCGKTWTKDTRKDIFRGVAARVAEVCAQGGEELARYERMGRLGKIARRAGGVAFRPLHIPRRLEEAGRHPLRPQPLPGPGQDVLALALVTSSLETVLQAASRAHRAVREQEAKVEKEQATALAVWQEQHPAALVAMGIPEVGVDAGVVSQPAPTTLGFDIDVVEWALPASKSSVKALSAARTEKSSKLLQSLRSTWEERHKPLVASTMKSVPAPAVKVPLCFVAGFCLCGPTMSVVRSAAEALEKAMRELLVKDSLPRKLYDNGYLVLRLFDDYGEELWWHLPYANLNTMRMTMLRLQRCQDPDMQEVAEALGLVCLDHDPGSEELGMANHWSVCRALDLDLRWHVSLHRLYTEEFPLDSFVVGRNLFVKGMASVPAVNFWKGSRPARIDSP